MSEKTMINKWSIAGGIAVITVVIAVLISINGHWARPKGPQRIPKVIQAPEVREIRDIDVKIRPVQTLSESKKTMSAASDKHSEKK